MSVYMKLLVVIALTLTLSHGVVHAQMTDKEQTVIVGHHNLLRALEGAGDMEYLTWDESLAGTAKTWLEKCDLANREQGTEEGEHPGLNVFTAKDDKIDFIQAVQSWFDKKYAYDHRSELCGDPSVDGCKPYLQLVSSQTRKIGCATHSCSGSTGSTGSNSTGDARTGEAGTGTGTILACNYLPGTQAGNIYQIGRACSKCSSGAAWCKNELCNRDCTKAGKDCTCNAICYNCGTLDKNTCKCSCVDPWSGPNCAQPCVDGTVCEGKDADQCNEGQMAIYCPVLCNKCKAAAGNSTVTEHCAPVFAGLLGGEQPKVPKPEGADKDDDKDGSDVDLETDAAGCLQYQHLLLYVMLAVSHYYMDSSATLT